MIEQASKKVVKGKFKQANYYEIPFEDNMFENVVSTYALGGTKINVDKVLSEMIRVCKSNGQIIILDWQEKQNMSLIDRLFVKIARLTEDAPKDFIGIFSKLGYNAKHVRLSNTYSIIKVTKSKARTLDTP